MNTQLQSYLFLFVPFNLYSTAWKTLMYFIFEKFPVRKQLLESFWF